MALLITVTVLARVILKERITVVKIISIILSILAVFLVIQPSFIFGTYQSFEDRNDDEEELAIMHLLKMLDDKQIAFMRAPLPDGLLYNVTNGTTRLPTEDPVVSIGDEILGYLMMILSGVSGAANTVIQKAKMNEVNPLILNFWTSIAMTLVPLVLCLIIEFDDLTFPTDAESILLVLGQSFASAFSFMLALQGVRRTTAIWITLALSLQIFFLIISQYTILHSIAPGKDNWIEIFGAVVVIVAAVIPPIWEVIKTKFDNRLRTRKLHPVNLNPSQTSEIKDS